MAFVSGKDGSLTFANGVTSKVTAWTCDLDAEEVNLTGIGELFRTYISGVEGWRGTYTTNIDTGDIRADTAVGAAVATTGTFALGAAAAAITMTFGNTAAITGNCIVTGVNLAMTQEAGPGQIVCNFVGSGQLTSAAGT